MGESAYLTLSQKATWGKKAVEGFLATTVTFGVIERNAIRAVDGAGVRSCEEEGERPLINSICFANVLPARADMIIYTVRRAMPTFLP